MDSLWLHSSRRHRARCLALLLIAWLWILVAPAPFYIATATASAATFTYDATASTRVHLHATDLVTVESAEPAGLWEESASARPRRTLPTPTRPRNRLTADEFKPTSIEGTDRSVRYLEPFVAGGESFEFSTKQCAEFVVSVMGGALEASTQRLRHHVRRPTVPHQPMTDPDSVTPKVRQSRTGIQPGCGRVEVPRFRVDAGVGSG